METQLRATAVTLLALLSQGGLVQLQVLPAWKFVEKESSLCQKPATMETLWLWMDVIAPVRSSQDGHVRHLGPHVPRFVEILYFQGQKHVTMGTWLHWTDVVLFV